MKRYLLYLFGVLSVILISLSLMDVSGSEEEIQSQPVISINTKAKAFQLGAFLDLEKAKSFADLNGGIVVNKDNYYYVYKSILTISTNINRMNEYLKNTGVNFYLKDIDISEEFSNNETVLEESMVSATSDVAFMTLNSKILNMYEGKYEN